MQMACIPWTDIFRCRYLQVHSDGHKLDVAFSVTGVIYRIIQILRIKIYKTTNIRA
jgi:hypothetical protein